MDLCGAYITHKVFGRGQIIDFQTDCVTILFQNANEKKKFVYPNAFGTFLTLENKQLSNQVQKYQNEIALNIAVAQVKAENLRSLKKKEKAKKPTRKTVKK